MLNRIWTAFFFIAFLAACVQAIFFGNPGVFREIVVSTFDMAKAGFEIALGLTGALAEELTSV